MKTMTVKVRSIIIAAIACLVCVAAMSFIGVRGANAETFLDSDDDFFELIEAYYDADESFEFSAVAEFERGNAAGLVFGASADEKYWVFNVDRAANAVKLMYFDCTSGEKVVDVLMEEEYVGSHIMNSGEREYVQSRTAAINKVYLKVSIAPTDDGIFAEFYADGIRRFAYTDGSEEAKKIDLSFVAVSDEEGGKTVSYEGGWIGYNCFNASVRFTDEKINENADYTEIYRNQYHFSQFAHWNNDPNGLVYYKGYYHLYFQHNPYGNTWDAMHWGHARSRDLVHWELLPIALIPDRDLSTDIGAMWSGSARVYHKGDSDKIDNEYKWFGDSADKNVGDALGLIGFYTRFDNGGNRHQVVMYSTDGGLSWNKRDNIPCNVSKNLDGSAVTGGSWRDPKVFDISEISGISGGYKWGMALTDMEDNTLFFLKSRNLVEWEHAGCYEVFRPECPDVVFINDGARERTVITFTSRYYVVCDLSYDNGNIVMRDENGKITSLMQGDPRLKKMDYGVDSYAAQTFYIDNNSDSAYAGKSVSMSWFSGVPNAAESIESGVLQSARKTWNGGGMTVPVVYGLKGTTLTATPITVADENFAELKTSLVDIKYSAVSDGILDTVESRTAEISAKLSNPSCTGVSIKVNMNADGSSYTEIGWNKSEGYYVDRTHTEDGGINFPQPNYAIRYASGMGKSNTVLDFYILVDRNNVEVYCDGFTVPFYILTFASPYSNGMSLTSENDITLLELKVNEIGSIWRERGETSEFYVSETSVELSTELTTEREITVVGKDFTYEITEGDAAELIPTDTGFKIKAVTSGTATVEVRCGEFKRTIDVTVYSGYADSDLTFADEGVVSGEWYMDGDTIVGKQLGGDGFLLADESGADFIYGATFDLGTGAAAAIVFRAEARDGKLDSYIIANYDNNGHVVKLWSQNGELGKADVTPADINNITLSAFVEGNTVKVSLDGREVISAILGDNEPKSGRYGLNACATRAVFKSVDIVPREYVYTDGELILGMGNNTRIDKIVNKTLANTEIPSGFYSLYNGELTVDVAYLSILPEAKVYTLGITGDKISLDVFVDVKEIPEYTVDSLTVAMGTDAVVFIGNRSSEYVKINDRAVASSVYEIKNYTLKINGDAFELGDNTVALSDGTLFTVSVYETDRDVVTIYIPPVPLDFVPFGIGFGIAGGLVLAYAIAVIAVLARVKKGKLEVSLPYRDRTEAIRRRNYGLIIAACIAGPVALLLAVSAATAPLGTVGLSIAAAAAAIFGYTYIAQLYWKGKLYAQTLSPVKAMGTPKDIFDVDKTGNKFKIALRYVAATFKTIWLGIRILLCAIVALLRAPFLFVGQMKAVTYGEFGFSNKADSIELAQEKSGEDKVAEVV